MHMSPVFAGIVTLAAIGIAFLVRTRRFYFIRYGETLLNAEHIALQGVRETVVVTHHVFLKMLIAYMLYRERLRAADFVKLSFFNISDNAGIIVCEFHSWKFFSKTCGWEVVSYNEQPE